MRTLQEEIEGAVQGFTGLLDDEDRGILVGQIMETIDQYETKRQVVEYLLRELGDGWGINQSVVPALAEALVSDPHLQITFRRLP